MRSLAIASLYALAITLSGCAAFTDAVNAINAPATQQALVTIENATLTIGKLTSGLACFVSAGTAAALAAEQAPVFAVSTNAQSITDAIYVGSAATCAVLGGTINTAPAANVTGITGVATSARQHRLRVIRR